MAELYNIVYPDRLIFPHTGAEKRQNKAFLHLCLKKNTQRKFEHRRKSDT